VVLTLMIRYPITTWSVTSFGCSVFAWRKPFMKSFLSLYSSRFCIRSVKRATQKPAALLKFGKLRGRYGFLERRWSSLGI
jgi:hypothetical protein